MWLPTCFHILWKTAVEPVKWTPAMSSCVITGSPIVAPEPGTKLITPSGRPASRSSSMTAQPDSTAVLAGFQMQTLPMSAGAVGRLPAMDVKLNGVTANTNPSRLRYSQRFHMPGWLPGCMASRSRA